eukprot:6718027-Alexandrium_andersonii.AAC.1
MPQGTAKGQPAAWVRRLMHRGHATIGFLVAGLRYPPGWQHLRTANLAGHRNADVQPSKPKVASTER